MYTIFVVGNIGSGKSAMCQAFSENNAFYINCDQIAREIFEYDGIQEKLVASFGSQILEKENKHLSPYNHVNRAKLADVVFSDANKLNFLNELMLPQIIEEFLDQLSLTSKAGLFSFCVCEVPLFDKCLELAKIVDEIIYVKTNKETCILRCVERGMTQLDASRRYDLQASEDFYEEHSSCIFENNGSQQDLYEFVENYIKQHNLG